MLNIIDVSATNECQYSCRYCIAKAYKSMQEGGCGSRLATVKTGSQIHPDVLIKWIKSHFEPGDAIVQFSGGEPLLYPSLKYAIQSLPGYRITVASNMDAFPEWLALFPRLFDCNVRLKMSFHPLMTTWADFRERIDKVPRDRGLVNLVLYPQFLIAGMDGEYIRNIKESGWKWNVNAFKGDFNGEWWDKDRKEIQGRIAWDTPHKPFRIFSVNPNGNASQCYKHHLGNIYEGKDMPLMLDGAKCVAERLREGTEYSTCDGYCALCKLWDI